MKILKTLLLSLLLLFSTQLQSQSCSCGYFYSIADGSAYQYDFNCHMYVKAYFKDGHMGDWIPPYNYNFSGHSSSKIIYDSDFIEVFDPAEAQAVYYPCDHSAVVRHNGCLISKANFGSDLYRHGLTGLGCGATGIRYYKYKYPNSAHAKGIDESCLPGGGEPNCPVSCNISGTYNGSNPMYTFNTVTTYYNSANVTCSEADYFTWTITGGSVVYDNCSNSNCSSFYFYLNTGQSVTYQIKAYEECDNFISSKNSTFYRSSGGGWWLTIPEWESDFSQHGLLEKAAHPRELTLPTIGLELQGNPSFHFYPNPAKDQLNVQIQEEGMYSLSLININGQEVYRSQRIEGKLENTINLMDISSGIYFLKIFDGNGTRLYQEKVVVKKE